MEQKIFETVRGRLLEIEAEQGVTILYAVEAGSRAWGIESVESDYDIRFIYAHHKNWYLNIFPKRDVIEYPITGGFDYSGWDLRKAFFLLNKSNPVFFEWMKSPVVYRRDDYFYPEVAGLSREYFSPIAAVYHYLNMARENYRRLLQADTVKLKKYFYVLRPLLACGWIEKYREAPPLEFETLAAGIPPGELREEINGLLRKKRSGAELEAGPGPGAVNSFIEQSIRHFEDAAKTFDPAKKPEQRRLEETFVNILARIGQGVV
jgi:predicted nucleotidyltransferase